MKALWFESHKIKLEGFLLGFGRGGAGDDAERGGKERKYFSL